MKSDGISKPVLGALLFAVVLYVGGFALDQHLRTRRGPWRVEYSAEASGEPVLRINQPALGIHDVRIVLDGAKATNQPGVVAFDFPERRVPAGSVVFEDLTYLPGTVTLSLYEREIELLPRTLYLNRKPHAWRSGEVIHLKRAEGFALTNAPARY